MPNHLLLLLPWLALGLTETAFACAGVARPGALQLTAELAILLLLGLAQGRLPAGPWKSPVVPAVFGVAAAALLHLPAGLVSQFTYGVGAVVLSVVAVRVLDERLRPGPLVGVGLAVLGGVVGRYAVLSGSRVQDPRRQLAAELRAIPRALPQSSAVDAAPIILVSVDTLRWDHATGMDSYQRLASAGRAWPRAMASASWTLPSMSSIHTGQPAHVHGGGKIPGGGIAAPRPELPHLATRLRDAGWATGAIVTNPYLSAAMGFDSGFRDWLHINERAPHRLAALGLPWGPHAWEGELITRRALDWIDAAPEQGWFLWVHYLDAHLIYTHVPEGHIGASELSRGQMYSDAQKADLQEGYALEVSMVDGFVSALLDAAPGANIVFVSDHGEEFWDHGGFEHGHSHHGEVADVALAIAGPGVSPGTGEGLAAVQDVYATVLGLAGLDAPEAPQSVDLRGPIPPERIVVASGNLYDRVDWSARSGAERLIVRGDGAAAAYDLAADPSEAQPLPAAPDGRLWQAISSAQSEQAAGAQQEQNAAALRALGYLE